MWLTFSASLSQRERETIDASREELKAKLAAIKVQVQSHVKELNDNIQEERDTRHEIIDNYYDVASHLKEIKHGYFDLQKDLEPNPLGLSDRDQITKIRVQMEASSPWAPFAMLVQHVLNVFPSRFRVGDEGAQHARPLLRLDDDASDPGGATDHPPGHFETLQLSYPDQSPSTRRCAGCGRDPSCDEGHAYGL